MIPTIKKEIASFMLEEKGEISKHQIISFGAVLSGLAALNILTKVVAGQQISALHDHCDPGASCHGNADASPESHCSAHASGGWGCGSGWSVINVGHYNNIILNYG